MPEGIEIAPYRPELREQILTLQKRLWSPARDTNSRYLEWKYELNPDRPDGLIVVALRGGEVVAMRGFMGARWRFGTDAPAFAIPAAGDTVIAEAFEGRGLFNALNEAARAIYRQRGIRFLMNTSASAPVFLRSRRAGWRSPGPYLVLRRRADRLAAANGLMRGAEILARLDSIDGRRLSDGCALGVREAPLPHEMATLMQSLPADGRLRRVRDRSYFAWRYRSPLGAYRFIVAHRGEALNAFVVLRRRLADESPSLEIADWAAPSEPRLVDLLAALTEAVPGESLAIWANSLSAGVQGELAKHGFQPAVAARPPSPYTRSLLLISTEEGAGPDDYVVGGRSLLTYETWDFRLIDSDGA